MFDLTHFTLSDMVRCGPEIRRLSKDCENMEAAANKIVEFFFTHFKDRDTGEPQCILARFYLTVPFNGLPAGLQEFALKDLHGETLPPQTRCFTLLATRGIEPAWNSRTASASHQAIPLPSVEVLTQLPMVSRLFQQLGLEMNAVIAPNSAMFIVLEQKTYNIFYVAEALGSAYIPAQDSFVIPYHVSSVLGFGGVLPDGQLFAVILFTRPPVAQETAEFFKTISLSIKMGILAFSEESRVFGPC